VRDHDGDGVPDKSDPKPFDASIWCLCTGYVNLTIENDLNETIWYTIHAYSTELIENLTWQFFVAEPFSNLTQLLKLDWWGGQGSIDVYLVVVGDNPVLWKMYSWWNESVTITNAQSVAISLVCPDDFNPSWYYG
jgi:hypothetical protein